MHLHHDAVGCLARNIICIVDEQYEVVAGVIVVLDDLVIELIYQLIVLKLALPEFIQEFLCAAFKLL